MKKELIQQTLFTVSLEPKKEKYKLSEEEKIIRHERSDAKISWKLYKSRQFDHLLTEKDRYYLKQYYGVIL